MPELVIRSMAGHPEWIEACADWWHRQWGEAMGYSLPAARAAIADLTLPNGTQGAFIALLDGSPAGSVFLVDSDLESRPDLTPWLAGLFVLPTARRQGVATALVASILTHAESVGHETVFLYTSIADFYRRLGWKRREILTLHDIEHEIMSHSLPFRSPP